MHISPHLRIVSAGELVQFAVDELSFLDDIIHDGSSGAKGRHDAGRPARCDDILAISRLAGHCAAWAAQHFEIPEHDFRVRDAVGRLVELACNKPEPDREKEWPWNPL